MVASNHVEGSRDGDPTANAINGYKLLATVYSQAALSCLSCTCKLCSTGATVLTAMTVIMTCAAVALEQDNPDLLSEVDNKMYELSSKFTT